MSNPAIKFYKSNIEPTEAAPGSVWFDSSKRLVRVRTTTNSWEDYSGIQSITYSNKSLTWTNADGSANSITFEDVASAAALQSLTETVGGISTDLSNVSTKVETTSTNLGKVSSAVGELPTTDQVDTLITERLSTLDWTTATPTGYVIQSIKQENGKVTPTSIAVIDTLTFALDGNSLIITDLAGTTQQVELDKFAQDKYISTVEYIEAEKALQFTWKEADDSDTSIKVPVGDLVDTYSAGTGLTLANSTFSIDAATMAKINATDYVRSVTSGSTTAKSINFAVDGEGKLSGSVYGVYSQAETSTQVSAGVSEAISYADNKIANALTWTLFG